MANPESPRKGQIPPFETPQPIALSIELGRGMVHVILSDRTDTVVAVNPSDPGTSADVEAASKTAVDLANGTLSIRMTKPGGMAAPIVGWKRSGSVDVIVELPEGSSLRADTGVADFRCDGRLGDVDVRTGVGNVLLDQTGALQLHSGMGRFALENASANAQIVTAGEITIGTIAGDVDIKNRNGTTWIERVEGNVMVKSANGGVTIEDAGGDVNVKTANGDISLGQITRGSATVETAMGRIEIGIEDGTAAWIDANTRFGQINNGLSPAVHPDQSVETVQVHARTAFGDVLITRS